MEYLGDAVLQLVTAEYLFRATPEAREGELTQVRSQMVNTNTLGALGQQLELGSYLLLGKGLRSSGRQLRSVLANAFEALMGAIFLDAGFDAAYQIYLHLYLSLPPAKDENYKGRLQHLVQERFGVTPRYAIVASVGPGHKRKYAAAVSASEQVLGEGQGNTKQNAEQEAAKAAIAWLDGASDAAAGD